jgi:hypothetical protein
MRRKAIAIVAALFLVAAGAAPVFATAPEDWSGWAQGSGGSAKIQDRVVQSNDDEHLLSDVYQWNGFTNDDSIPVYGYVGEDIEDVIDPDPKDPDVNPFPYQIDVSVPTKILWAAFESDLGAVSSPEYYIKNNNAQTPNGKDVSVTVYSFSKRAEGTHQGENEAIDRYLNLYITPTGVGFNTTNVNGVQILKGDNTSVTYIASTTPQTKILCTNGSVNNSASLGATKWTFKIGGAYAHASNPEGWTRAYTPEYDLVFKFAVV